MDSQKKVLNVKRACHSVMRSSLSMETLSLTKFPYSICAVLQPVSMQLVFVFLIYICFIAGNVKIITIQNINKYDQIKSIALQLVPYR